MAIANTTHRLLIGTAQQEIAKLPAEFVQLVVTSPPYPMIEMWDEIIAAQNQDLAIAQLNADGAGSFELMHQELDKIWEQVARVTSPGGFACINIGDATRTIGDNFSLYNNHSRIVSAFIKLGFNNLPNIIWRKQTNAPNKFMGSGMLPAGAYVTLEHEWILIFRKGGKRVFKAEVEKELRRESAFFWEERNIWFSDLWDLKGVKQKMESPNSRSRSAAYPFEIPYRLINMYSVKGDTVLDPFLGTGTTTLAAMASERNSIGVELDAALLPLVQDNITVAAPVQLNRYIQNRIDQHKKFVTTRMQDEDKGEMKYFNDNLNLPVMTSQETGMKLSYISQLIRSETGVNVSYITTEKNDYLPLIKRSAPNQELLAFN